MKIRTLLVCLLLPLSALGQSLPSPTVNHITATTITASTINGTPTIAAPTITGHPTLESVTSTGATGTGKLVFSGSPSLTTPNLGSASATAMNLTGAPSFAILPTGNAATTYSSFSAQGTSVASNTSREFLMSCGLTVNTVNGSGAQEGNVCLYSGVVGQAGGGDVWSINSLVSMQTGYSGTAHGWELDFNNNSGTHYGDTADVAGLSAPSAYGLNMTGAATNRATSALLVSGTITGSNPMWNRGITFANNSIAQVAIADYTNSPTVLKVLNTHTAIIDAGGATATSSAIWPSASPMYWGSTSGAQVVGTSGKSVGMGGGNTVAGTANFVMGLNNAAGGLHNIVMGQGAYDQNRTGISVLSSMNVNGSVGSSQVSHAVPVTRTTSTTAQKMSTDSTTGGTNSGDCVNLPNNSAFRLDAQVIQRDTTTGNAATYESRGVLVTRGATAATTAIAGTPTFTMNQNSGSLTGTVSWVVDTTNGCAAVSVAAPNANTTDWAAHVTSLEVQ